MRLAVEAWRVREAARRSLEAGDLGGALSLAREAQQRHGTRSGEQLRLLCEWLRKPGD